MKEFLYDLKTKCSGGYLGHLFVPSLLCAFTKRLIGSGRAKKKKNITLFCACVFLLYLEGKQRFVW